MAEWPNVPDSKSGVPQGTVGSNPTLSAKDMFSTVHNGTEKHPKSPCSKTEPGLSCAHCSAIKFKFQLGCGLPTAALLSGGKISHFVRWCTAPDRCKLGALLIVFQTLLLCSRRPSSSPHLRCISVLKQTCAFAFCMPMNRAHISILTKPKAKLDTQTKSSRTLNYSHIVTAFPLTYVCGVPNR